MSNQLIAMNKIKQILQWYTEGVGKKTITRKASVNRNTVKSYIRQFIAMDKSLEELLTLSVGQYLKELPHLPKYTPYDTIHSLSNSFNRKSEQFEDQHLIEIPNNSNKIDSLPKNIEIRINGITYTGLLNTRKLEEVLEWDGKDGSGTVLYKGLEAIYIVHLKD